MPFVSNDYVPPTTYHFDQFLLEVLSPKFATQDFAAITASADDIRYVFGPTNEWPSGQMNFAENLADLTRHEKEFTDRKAFAYAILSSDEKRYLGCIYIKPIKSKIEDDLRKSLYDAQVFFWLDSVVKTSDLVQSILTRLQIWLQEAWPFKAVVFPGQTIGWEEWEPMAIQRSHSG
jgi:hypothetical protein